MRKPQGGGAPDLFLETILHYMYVCSHYKKSSLEHFGMLAVRFRSVYRSIVFVILTTALLPVVFNDAWNESEIRGYTCSGCDCVDQTVPVSTIVNTTTHNVLEWLC